MIADVDDDGSGSIEFEEFLKMMTHKILNRDPKDEILKAFRLFDDDETGKISFKNLKRVAKELGERMTDEELQERFRTLRAARTTAPSHLGRQPGLVGARGQGRDPPSGTAGHGQTAAPLERL